MSSCPPAGFCFRYLLVVFLCLAAMPLFAAEPAGPSEALRYRRIFVPADELNSQAKGMVPLKREEFERRIVAWTSRQPNSLAAQVRVERATYSARLDKDQLVGNARLEAVNATTEPALIAWDSTLPLGKPFWDEQPPRPARLGTTPNGEAVLLVEKSGRLIVPWTLRGGTSEQLESTFELLLPKAAISRLVLQLPAGMTPETDAGIVSRLEPEAPDTQFIPANNAASSMNWLVELGGLSQLRLSLKNTAKGAPKDELVLVRESATHLLSPVDVSSDFGLQLDIHRTSLTSLRLEVDATTRLIGIRLGGAPLSWRAATPSSSQQTAFQVDLPEALTGSGNGLTISAVSPLEPGLPWRLPRVRLAGGTWQEGTATLVVPPALRVGNIQFTDARQTSISPGSLTQPERTYHFQYLSPLGQVAVHSARDASDLKVQAGLVIRHEATQLSAALHLDLAVDSGERFALEGITSDEWIVDSVDTLPPELLEERQFVPLGGRKFALRLRLARPLTAKDKTRLVIRAHRQLPADGESISASGLRLVEFQEVRDEHLVVALRATEITQEFQVSGDLDLFRMDPESAAPEELSLLDSSTAGILFRVDRQGEGARASLVPSDPRFTAGIESSALVQRRKIEHHAIARITPASSSLTRLIVRCSGPVPAAMKWRLVGAGDLSIASQTMLPALLPSAPEGPKESVWELVLSHITTQPIALEATWETPFSLGEVLPLFSFPEAVAQEGLVRVEAEQGVSLQLETAGVKPVPRELAAAGSYSPIRGLFRYEPGRQATVSLRSPRQADTLPSAWASRCTLQSRFSPNGAATHEIIWRLENHSLDRFPFSLPEGVRPAQITIDGEGVAIPLLDAPTRQYFVPLPRQRRNPVITLTVSTTAPESSSILGYRWFAPLVTTPLPVLDRRWQVTLPPGIQQVSSGRDSAGSMSPESWRELWKKGYAIWQARLWGVLTPPNSAEHLEFESPWSETEPLMVSVYAPGVVRLWGISLAIAVASLVIWLAPYRFVSILFLAVLFACVALLVPLAWSPLAAGIAWGAAAGGLFNLARPRAVLRSAPAPASVPSTQTKMATNLIGSFLLLLLGAVHDSSIAAAPDESNDKGPVTKIHLVIIPLDADQKPLGDYVYVPLDFYTLLYRAPEREQLPAWLLRSATHEMEASDDSSVATIVTRLELETLIPQAKVALPLRRGEIHLLEGRATLDGEPITLDWDEAGASLRLEIERPGVFQLTLAYSAAAKEVNGAAHWDFSIPKAPRASLRIKSPSRPSDWLLPSAQGGIAKPEGNGDLLAELGPAAALRVTRQDPRRLANETTEAEQLVWWKFRPGSVTADVLVRIRAVTGKISQIKLLVDPRLRLLPLENEPRVSRVWVEEGELSTIHLTLVEPATELELRGKFLLLEASGIGKLVLPRLEVLADRKTKQWQAISVGNESTVLPDSQIPIISHPPVDFVDSFGGAARPPDLAFEAAGQGPAFLVRPQEKIVHAKEFVDVSLGRHDAQIRYRADLTGIPLHRFQEVIDLPAGFRVKQAVLLEQDAAVSLRAPTAQQGSLTIHRAQPPSTAQQLLIEGMLPLGLLPGQPDLVRLPSLRIAASDGATIRIYRTSASLANITASTGMQPSATPEGAPWDARLGHLLASYKSDPTSVPGVREFSVESKPNNPTTTFRLVTKMERTTPRSWSAVVNCDVTWSSGMLDAVRMEVPAEWSGPFELTPAMDHEVVLLPGQTQRHLIIRPGQGHREKLSFSIRGPLKLQTGETPHAPVLVPLDGIRVDSFLLLPSRAADENLEWQTSGLQAMAAGESKEAKLAMPGDEVFRVVAPRFAATLLQSKDSRKSARIVLADLEVHPRLAGSYWILAKYYLHPGGSGEAELHLPVGSQLVQVLVNDSPADIRNQSAGTWSVRLGHEQLPQQLVVIYVCPQQGTSDAPLAIPPAWRGIPIENTIWTLLPAKVNLEPSSQAAHDPDAVDPRRAALAKMAAIISLVREAGDSGVSGLPPQQLADWLSLWRVEFARADQASVFAARPTDINHAPVTDRLESERLALEAEFSAALSRYSDLQIASPPPGVKSDVEPVPLGWVPTLITQAGAPLPQRLATSAPPSNLGHRLGLAIFVLGLACAVAFLLSSARWQEAYCRAPAYALVFAAIAILVFLPVGLIPAIILAAASVWFSLRPSWPAPKPDDSSRILRPNLHSRRGSR